MSIEISQSVTLIHERVSFGGAVCVALDVHSDLPIPRHKKLPVLETELDRSSKAIKSACWAYTEMCKSKPEHAVAAYVCIIYNLVAKDDGDSISSDSTLDYDEWIVDTVKDLLTEVHLKKALTAIISSKINFWEIGTHIGNTTLKGHAEKVAKSLYNMDEKNRGEITDLFNTIGHWASTIKVLNAFNIKDLKEVHDYENIGEDILELDVKSHVLESPSVFPAGTTKHADSYEICKLLADHPLLPYVPHIFNFVELSETIEEIKKNPVFYHEKASYLNGEKREKFDDNLAQRYLGRLAPFVFYCFPEHPTAKSKNVSQMKYGRRYLKCYEYEDYDKSWETLCKRYQQSQQLPIEPDSLDNLFKNLNPTKQSSENVLQFANLFK